jgi:hypothetical protein
MVSDEKFWSVFNRRNPQWQGLFRTRQPAPQIAFEQWIEGGVKHFKVYELICEFTETVKDEGTK